MLGRTGRPRSQAAQGVAPFYPARAVRLLMPLWLAGLALGGLLMAPPAVPAGEASKEESRQDVVTALERGAGPSKGSANAPVILVGFSDFQCSYCRKFWHETFPKIEAQYIRPGKVRFVYRHLAVLGSRSVLAAEAASCANDQGKFWQYHEALFGNMAPYVMSSARLKQIAATLGLDGASFATCLDSQKYAQRIEAETYLAHTLGVTGTPAFLINGQLVVGAYPFESFQDYLNAMLADLQRTPAK